MIMHQLSITRSVFKKYQTYCLLTPVHSLDMKKWLTCRILATSSTGNSLAFFEDSTGIIVSLSPSGIF